MSYIVYTSQIFSVQVLERDVTARQVAVGSVMYFTYAQLFLILLAKSFYAYAGSRLRRKVIKWDKTERFKGGSS
ncbi:hypothetical protein [Marinococcus halotolerans]|uniref:hypothetical protein n=1 Tax=Marinococcus halotolerans TaxID=301092 RepID=UPI0012EC9CD7|nr:hypothetical protein [Marinococcus halotolerans]